MKKNRKVFVSFLCLGVGLLIVCIIAIGIFVYGTFRRDPINDEAVFAATEIGTPIGDKVTKDIGPEGGSITSADGRLTVIVGEHTLTEPLAFSVQPVTNTFQTGLGPSYRLEPEGKTFKIPVDISVQYDDRDLEGSFPEALSVAYQDNDGAWHMQPGIELDKENKTVTLPATHFSVYTFIYVAKLSPAKATIHPGESIKIRSTFCSPLTLLVFPSYRKEKWKCDTAGTWALQGEGKLAGEYPDVVYTAPGKKPTPNVATILFADANAVIVVEVPRPCTMADNQYGLWGKNDEHEWMRVPTRCFDKVKMAPELDTVRSVITIVDRGYKVSGTVGDLDFQGVICDPEKTFTVKTNSPFHNDFFFTPSSSTGGTWKFAMKGGFSGGGAGKYTLDGLDSAAPKLTIGGDSSGCYHGICGSGGGVAQLNLTPLTSADGECGK